ncbi:MAG: ABC transporter ATP-binding protein [Calditrichales bacterium]|nr:MAG: ABC transporter ATP-binding protein [Calditrichales bacterium]
MQPVEQKQHKFSANSLKYVFREILLPSKNLLFLGLVLIIINRLSGLVLPGASKYLIDEVIVKSDRSLLYLILTAVAAAVLIQSVSSFALTRLLSVEAQRLISILRTQVQHQIIHLPIRFFDNTKSGVLVSRIMTDVEGVRNLVGTGLVQMIGGFLTAVISLVILIRINLLMAVLTVIPLIIFGLISLKAFAFIRPIFRKRGEINADVTGRLTESLGGIRVIKGFHAESHEIDIFKQGVDRLFENVKTSLTSTSLITSSATLLLGLAAVLVMGVGGIQIIDKMMTVGDFFAFTLYLGFLVAPIVQMSNIGSQISEAFAGLDRMQEVLSLEKEGQEAARVLELEKLKGDISFENVSFSYDDGNEVIHDISFQAPSGSVIALVGSSGSGKTTIAGLAASFLKPNNGKVRIDGIDLATVKLSSFRARLGVVLQDDFLFEGSIRDNIRFAHPDANKAALTAAVKAAHVKEFADRLPDGLDTIIGERGVKLSGGQRQRVAIARAILADPRILILDEATSNLDTESEALIQDSLSGLMEGRTTFVIAHRLSTIHRADQILVIENGKIAEQGTHDTLIAMQGRYYQLYTYQARI